MFSSKLFDHQSAGMQEKPIVTLPGGFYQSIEPLTGATSPTVCRICEVAVLVSCTILATSAPMETMENIVVEGLPFDLQWISLILGYPRFQGNLHILFCVSLDCSLRELINRKTPCIFHGKISMVKPGLDVPLDQPVQ